MHIQSLLRHQLGYQTLASNVRMQSVVTSVRTPTHLFIVRNNLHLGVSLVTALPLKLQSVSKEVYWMITISPHKL